MDFVVDGKPLKVRMRSRLAANEGDAYLQCGLRGLGLIQITEFVALSLPSKRRSLGECVKLTQGGRKDGQSESSIYAGIHDRSGAHGPRRAEHGGGGEDPGDQPEDAAQLG